jgi:hypothetical protein
MKNEFSKCVAFFLLLIAAQTAKTQIDAPYGNVSTRCDTVNHLVCGHVKTLENGKHLTGVKVMLGNKVTYSNPAGYFIFEDVPSGAYRLKAIYDETEYGFSNALAVRNRVKVNMLLVH